MKINKFFTTIFLLFTSISTSAALLDLTHFPLSVSQHAPPLTLLVMSKNHKLYYEAYNDTTDLNEDNVLDIRYKPSIDYFGYFDSFKCYSYSNNIFVPTNVTADKKCTGKWSGDFLNYLTMSRMDVIRKVLYGGTRSTDVEGQTILERTYLPQDGHSWGKEYTSIGTDSFDIRDYTPFPLPEDGKRHLFASTTLLQGTSKDPYLRTLLNQPYRIWDWVSIEKPVAGDKVLHGKTGIDISNQITDYNVRLEVCKDGLLEQNCRHYPMGTFKPIGLLQEYGENDLMRFGLLTGSFNKNLSGGVIRKNITSFTDEIDLNTGIFIEPSHDERGIRYTLDTLKILSFQGDYTYEMNCGSIYHRPLYQGECADWGNPLAEMLYEGVRYFAGKKNPTFDFAHAGQGSGGRDEGMQLPEPKWKNDPDELYSKCAKQNILVISDIYPTYDDNQVPGSYFSSFSGDLPSLNVSTLGQTIWNQENNNQSKVHYIGQSGAIYDGTPSPKLVTSFGNIRGLSPEEPNKKGTFYSASMAYYAKTQDINDIDGDQHITTYAVGLKSNTPEFKIKANDQLITLIPFGKSVGSQSGCLSNIDSTKGLFQPTSSIVDVYIDEITETNGTFRVIYEDTQQGSDYEMDAVAKYHYFVNEDGTVTVEVESTYAASCIIQHLGYVISGTTQDGVYLEVRDLDTPEEDDINYFLDTPAGEAPGGNWQTGTPLPLQTTRTFSPGSAPAATSLKNPLWYAAKWGGFKDQNGNNIPDLPEEFDTNDDQIPDNYFLATNALNMKRKFTDAIEKILKDSFSTVPILFNSNKIHSETKLYFTRYNTADWSSNLFAFDVNTFNNLIAQDAAPTGSEALWDAAQKIGEQHYDSGRQIITYNNNSHQGVPFRWPSSPTSPSNNELTLAQVQTLSSNPQTNTSDALGQQRLNYIRGERYNELENGGLFRNRTFVLGDIINSKPTYVSIPNQPNYFNWPSGSPEHLNSYSDFQTQQKDRIPMLYVGSNDGMLHAIDANQGFERFAYVPHASFNQLNQLTNLHYNHYYFVDGDLTIRDVLINNSWKTILVGSLNAGGRGIFALDITNPADVSESSANNLALWEYTSYDDPDLGYTFSKPVIARLNNGKWAAIFGNGYNNTEPFSNPSTTGNGVLYIVDIETGSLIKKFDTMHGMQQDFAGSGRPNGLTSPAVMDINNNNIADYVYVGDLFGNMWKIDISSSNPADWDFAYYDSTTPKPLFTAINSAGESQPITSAPDFKRSPYEIGQYYVFFGTGKYIERRDVMDTSVQTFYGIIDNFVSPIDGRHELLQQEILDNITVPETKMTYRITTDYTVENPQRGWFMDLVEKNQYLGERVVTEPIIRDSRIIFATLIPSRDVCSYGGSSWLMELDWKNGSRLSYSLFDVNGDGYFNSSDFLNYNGEFIPASGVKSDIGIITQPTIILDNNEELTYLTGAQSKIKILATNGKGMGRHSWKQLF